MTSYTSDPRIQQNKAARLQVVHATIVIEAEKLNVLLIYVALNTKILQYGELCIWLAYVRLSMRKF